ncbi:MAG: squalene synthase HpnC [Proteobacteria bacterium]|jgi:farnesyl-diphosphate farnesyltransferase|nr:squalene/phytoene synthase family protein [Alphaproteobacteria bacterium]NCC02726.1 squalene synthase HpnC [Pseudomonadota bacterium]
MPPIEMPSGKNETTENFPVTKLIDKTHRPHVAAYYSFARAADDISDSETLSPEEKILRLDQFDAALMNESDNSIESVIPLRNSLKETGVSSDHARELLVAFKRDVTKLRYKNWEELLDYCRYSAAPVGRYLLDLHGEDHASWPANDALCSVLQITNHIQDCATDLCELNRLYIPLDMLAARGATIDDVKAKTSSPSLRSVFNDMIDKMGPMMDLAHTFPPQVKNRMLRIDTAVINNVADELLRELTKRDPLAEPVKLSKGQKLMALIDGVLRGFF